MDLLRAVLQPSINEEIRGVFNKYMKVSCTGHSHSASEDWEPEPGSGCSRGAGCCTQARAHLAADTLLLLPQFFQKAALNVRDNVGEEVDPEQLIQETCRSCLEQV